MVDFLKKLEKNFADYIFDPSVDIKDRSFMVFSAAVLVSLFLAVPAGIIMHEPLSATLSTLAGAIFFTIFVLAAIRLKKINQAKIIVSIILIFIFLPAMFFTNGGAQGGAPIWLLLGTIYIAMIMDGRFKVVMLITNTIVTTLTWIAGYYHPEFVTEYSRGDNYFDTYAGIFIVGGVVFVLFSFQNRLSKKDQEHKNLLRLFEQTATSLANAIDAKDEYTRGHSTRVAEYSKKIAEQAGKSPSECEDIYYVALLHDVGKIGISEAIINKDGKLTDEEYEEMKKHPVVGNQILSGITEYPYLSIGAHYHHERYDGKGYPDRLKGEDIPEIARIISVADAYDAMTSKRRYRKSIPQVMVREEIVKGSGTQFDPKFAKIMQHLIDMDTEYKMREKGESKEFEGRMDLVCKKFRDDTSDGIILTPEIRTVRFKCSSVDTRKECRPGAIIFDSLDGRYHDTPKEMKELNYFEYAEIRVDGNYTCSGARKIQVDTIVGSAGRGTAGDSTDYELSIVKKNDHVQINVSDGSKTLRFIIALPDSSRYAYLSLTGENCHISDVSISKKDGEVSEDYIPRIAELISYIDGPEGDIPSVQIDGYRTAHTEGIPVKEGMEISFHTKSLPTARLVWHCAYLVLYWSADKKPTGKPYMEYALIRLDGEFWDAENVASNKMSAHKLYNFEGWESWKKANMEGFDCTVSFKRDGNKITATTENLGISIKNVTTILEEKDEVYLTITGDQCVITNIRIKR